MNVNSIHINKGDFRHCLTCLNREDFNSYQQYYVNWLQKLRERFKRTFLILINLKLLFNLCITLEFGINSTEFTQRLGNLPIYRWNFEIDLFL